MPTLLFKSEFDSARDWKQSLQSLLPELEVRIWPDSGDVGDIEYALIWTPIGDALHSLPNLKVVFSLGAGVDHLLQQQGLRRDVPIVRMVDPALTQGMSEYLLYHVLRYHRRMSEYAVQQRERRWQQLPQVVPQERRIGVMGLGVMGADVAGKLAALDFTVAGWSRSPKSVPGVRCFYGADQLHTFLSDIEILICLLPLTPQTQAIINQPTLATLPPGACVINVARGAHVNEDDLLTALDSGHIAGATLDVFADEPLPARHPFWGHPAVTVTPHIASLTNPSTAAAHIVANIRRHQRGEPLTDVVDWETGY
jgi:glyoxylate/hydroxypyruvate reductase A